jgi:hypothetical protein
MSDDLAQALLCLSFTIPAAGLLCFVFMHKNIQGGTDGENSATILEEDDEVHDNHHLSRIARGAIGTSITFCLVLIALVTLVTLFVAGHGSAAPTKCPLGF